ncbi:MAG: hypothetical protein DDT25_00441 [Chloroflexi bacterium]|nr:hypothetical protein [Chloroflexota bacterium]
MRHEGDRKRDAFGLILQLLDYLRQVTVSLESIGEDVLVDLSVMSGKSRGSTGSGDTRLAIDDDIGLNDPLSDGGGKSKDGSLAKFVEPGIADAEVVGNLVPHRILYLSYDPRIGAAVHFDWPLENGYPVW